MLYFWLKVIHILSATLLFGTGLGTAFYLLKAHLDKDTTYLAYTAKNVVLADWIFTTPAVIIQPLSGFALLHYLHYPLTTSWVMLALALYVLIGLCWIPVVWLQIKIKELAWNAMQADHNIFENPLYHRYFKAWFVLGWPAFIAVIAIFYLMTFKPGW